MAEFVITWPTGKTERWEQSDCETVAEAANVRFGSAAEQAAENGVNLELAADHDARMAGQQNQEPEETDEQAAARLAADSKPPLGEGTAPPEGTAEGSQADFEAIMKAQAAEMTKAEGSAQESSDGN